MTRPKWSLLQQRLGYEFTQESLLIQALTHRSFGAEHNERLEFLGDAILSCAIAQALYDQFPKAREGDLSRLRATLVRGETLAEMAREFELGAWLRLGQGERKSGGHNRSSILADAVEALIGAIALDSGTERALAMVLQWWAPRLASLDLQRMLKDPKTRLQEWQQAQGQPLPEYEVVEVMGEAHDQSFKVACRVVQLEQPMLAEDSSRRGAEQAAAQKILATLESRHD
jgi:ribonuclease-3